MAVVQLENGLRLACPRERSMDYNEVSLRALSREEFLQDMAVGVVKDGWALRMRILQFQEYSP